MKHKYLAYLPILYVLICLAYSNTLHSSFIYDDNSAILQKNLIQIKKFSFDSVLDILQNSGMHKRPLAKLTLALNHSLGGLDPFGYHILNILIHLLATTFVYLVMIELLTHPFLPKWKNCAHEAAFAVAGIWSLNPVNTQAVTYIIQRITSLSAMFYMAAFCCYIKARKSGKPRYLLVSLLLFISAVGSKEIAITLPVTIFFYEYFFRDANSETDRSRLLKTAAVFSVILLFAVFFYTGFKNPIIFIQAAGKGSTSTLHENITLINRLLTESRVMFYYISLFLFPAPSRQMLIYNYPPSSSLLNPPATLISLVIIFFLFYLAFRMRKRVLIPFFIIWYFLNMTLESTIIKLHLVFEHRLYLPSIAISAIAVSAASGMLLKYARKEWLGKGLLIFGLALSIPLALLSFNRNELWKDPITLYEDNLKKNPDSSALGVSLGREYHKAGMFRKALEQFEKVNRLAPTDFRAYIDKAAAYNELGMPEDALKALDMAITLSPGSFEIYINRGVAYSKKGMWHDAIREYETAVKLSPKNPAPYFNIGLISTMKKNNEDALYNFRKAALLKEDDYEIRINLALAYLRTGELDRALEEANKSLKLKRDDNLPSPYLVLGDLHMLKRDFRRAEYAYQKAIDEDYVEAIYKMGVLKGDALGLYTEAEEYFKLFLEKTSEDTYLRQRISAASFIKRTKKMIN